jgi:hypothetical protein
MRVERRFSDLVSARGLIPADKLVTYVSRHIAGGEVELGNPRTIFRRAHLRGDGGGRELTIEVVREPQLVTLIVSDTTRPPLEPGLSELERWKKGGIDRSGKITDPAQMQ